jgi:hypothetical protein
MTRATDDPGCDVCLAVEQGLSDSGPATCGRTELLPGHEQISGGDFRVGKCPDAARDSGRGRAEHRPPNSAAPYWEGIPKARCATRTPYPTCGRSKGYIAVASAPAPWRTKAVWGARQPGRRSL